MCGIFVAKDIVKETFENALSMMNHRGPDDHGIVEHDGIFFGHNRLSIVDLDERSKQPFYGSDGETLIVFNGEIYNYAELKKQFDINTKTTSDTEVLVELYIKIGEKCLQYLNGMFSFVTYNTRTKDFFVARDRLGIKPLYVFENGTSFIYSSELAPILEVVQQPDYDLVGIRQYLKVRTFFNGHTLYENIKMFPAGCYQKNGTMHKYWELDEKDAHADYSDDDIKELLNSAIEYRKVADVETGSYLSGGIDSSIIAAVSKKEHTWTIGFSDFNEFEYASMVAKKYGFNHHEILISEEEFKTLASYMIKKRKEPLSVPNEVSLFKMTKEVKKYNTVVLSGEGADELFFGYDRIYRWAHSNEFSLAGFDSLYSYGSHNDNEILDYILEPVNKIGNNLLKISKFFQIYHLHGLLRRLDNSTMLCSVEARVPFVDHRLIEYMYGASFDFNMKEGIVKAPLKRIYKDLLPLEVINRKKVGFPVPLKRIFQSKEDSMDGWLRFNIETLLDADWESVKQELKKDNVYV